MTTSGQTLLELVVAIGIVGIVIMALVASVTSSLRYGQATRFRSRGVKYAQEGIELARTLRDSKTWNEFLGYADGSGAWCLDSAGTFTTNDGSGECPIASGSTFWRKVNFSWNDPTMEVMVTVSWGARDRPSTVELTTHFTEWK